MKVPPDVYQLHHFNDNICLKKNQCNNFFRFCGPRHLDVSDVFLNRIGAAFQSNTWGNQVGILRIVESSQLLGDQVVEVAGAQSGHVR